MRHVGLRVIRPGSPGGRSCPGRSAARRFRCGGGEGSIALATAEGASRVFPVEGASVSNVGFGVIGLGMGRNHAKIIRETQGAALVAIADLDESRGREQEKALGAPWYADYREMLKRPEVDVAMVCTPSGLHHVMAVDAARAGKHVLTDKPMDVSLRNADAMI